MMRVKLQDVCRNESSSLMLKQIHKEGGDYPVYGASGLVGYADFFQQDKPYVAVVKDGAGIGRTMLLPAKSSVIGTMQYLIPNDTILPEYLYFVVKNMRLERFFSGATIPHIYFKTYKHEQFNLVDLKSQKKIVFVLGKVENLISDRERELALLDDLVKSRFVELFGTSHDGRCNTAMIGSICRFQQGTQIPVEMQIEEPRDGYVRFLRIIDYTQAPQPPRFVNVDGKVIDEKSVVIVRYGATAGFVGRGYSGILANNLFEVIPNETFIDKEFLYLALKHGTFERDIHEKAFGAAMPALSFSMMNDIPIVVPSHNDQKRFANFVAHVAKSKLCDCMEAAA